MTCEILKRGRGDVKSCFPFFLLQISFIYFWIFFNFIKCKGEQKQICKWKSRKENGGFGGERENSNANGGRMVEKKMG
jgi:hypothetical protein